MKNLKIKLKKTSKPLRIFFYIVFFLYLVSFGFMVRGLLLLSGIETFIRYLVIIIFLIIFFVYIISSLVFLILRKKFLLILFSSIMIILSVINSGVYYYINKTYSYINEISKDKVLYTTNLISLAGKKDIKKVGMIGEPSDPEGYILPKEYLAKNKNSYEIITYEDYFTMLNDLYDEEIDGLFITSNFVLIYSNTERFTNIKTDTRVHAVYSKHLKNTDLFESTNKSVTEPFTMLIMGVDSQYDGLSQNAAFNGDTLMLITFNPKTLSSTIFSIPRDTYVPIACNNNRSNKINSAAAYGSKCMVNTIENLTGITIDYYMKTNFKGLVALVDALGGITVDVPVPDYPKAYCVDDSNRVGKDICLTPGIQKLNGEKALALARIRDAFALSDFKRVQNQQLVIEAIVQKAKTIRNINDFYNVLNAISRNLDTNMSTKEMLNFYNVGKNILTKQNFKENDFISIEKTYLTGYDLTLHGAYTFQYYEESLNEIIKAMKVTLGLEKPDIPKTFTYSINEEYTPITVGQKTMGTKAETVPNFVSRTVDYLDNWNATHNLTIYKEYKESNICINNEILTQSVGSGVLLKETSSMTVTICKNIVTTPPRDPLPPTEILPPSNEEDEIDDNIEDMLN